MIHGKGSYKDRAGMKYIIDEYCFYYSLEYKEFIQANPGMYGASRKKDQKDARKRDLDP
jgi:hypothetical protein